MEPGPVALLCPAVGGKGCWEKEKDSIWTSGDSGSCDKAGLGSTESALVKAQWEPFGKLEDKEKFSWLESSSSCIALEDKLEIPWMEDVCLGREPWFIV